MGRFAVVAITLALLVSVGACGARQAQQVAASVSRSPSLAVNFDLTVPMGKQRVTGITLTPSHLPSGIAALQAVHDGRLTTVGSHRFHRLGDTSFLIVEVTSRGVRMGWAFGDARSSCGIAFPPRSTWAGASYGNDTLAPGEAETFWNLTRDTGKTSASGAGVNDASPQSVAASKKYPTETAYCVTITLNR